MEKILNEFGVQPLLLVAQIVNFLILLFILNKLLYKPILKVLADRKKKIENSLKQAEEIEKTLLKTEEDREKKLLKATDEAKEIIGDAAKASQQMIAEAHQKAQSDIEEIMKKTQEQVRQERDQMKIEVMSEVADVVALAMEKVTGKLLDKKDQKQMIERTVKEL